MWVLPFLAMCPRWVWAGGGSASSIGAIRLCQEEDFGQAWGSEVKGLNFYVQSSAPGARV